MLKSKVPGLLCPHKGNDAAALVDCVENLLGEGSLWGQWWSCEAAHRSAKGVVLESLPSWSREERMAACSSGCRRRPESPASSGSCLLWSAGCPGWLHCTHLVQVNFDLSPIGGDQAPTGRRALVYVVGQQQVVAGRIAETGHQHATFGGGWPDRFAAAFRRTPYSRPLPMMKQ